MSTPRAPLRCFLPLLIVSLFAVAACAPEQPAGRGEALPGEETFDIDAERTAVAEAIDGTIDWAKTKDFDRLYGIIVDDEEYLEVHPEGRVVRGITEFRQSEELFSSPDFRAISHEVTDLKITFSRSGEVAWFYCMLDDINEYQGRDFSWRDVRWTGVLEKRDGSWRMVQMHFSNVAEG